VRNYELFVWKNGKWHSCVRVAAVDAVDALRRAIQACADARLYPLKFEEDVAPFIDRNQPTN
jgi:hypothetical protein